jgi:hypothetical protein
LLHTDHTPIHLVQHMARTPSEEPKPTTPTITDDQAKELKRLDTILQISTDLKSRELRDKFRRIVIDGEMTKAQVYAQVRAFNLDYPMMGLLSRFSVRSCWRKSGNGIMRWKRLRLF